MARKYITNKNRVFYLTSVCTECGCLVNDEDLHNAWHDGSDKPTRTPLNTLLDIPVRTYNCLVKDGYNYVEDIVRLYDRQSDLNELLDIRGFGYKSYEDLTFALIRNGYLPQGTRGLYTNG